MAQERLVSYADIDGTLFNGNLGIQYVLYLMKHGKFNLAAGLEILMWNASYKFSLCPKARAVEKIDQIGARGVTGLSVETATKAAKIVWSHCRQHIYPFTQDVVTTLQQSGHRVLLVTGSPVEMANEFARHFHIPLSDVAAGQLEVDSKHMVYTGQVVQALGSAEQKLAAVCELTQSPSPNLQMAVGNNERDTLVLRQSQLPIALNPNQILRRQAAEYGWTIANSNTIVSTIRTNLGVVSQ